MVLSVGDTPQTAARVAGRAARKYMERHPPWLVVNAVGFGWQDFYRYSKAGLHVTGQAARFGVFMNSEGAEQAAYKDESLETDYPAHWPATSLRLRNVLRHRQTA